MVTEKMIEKCDPPNDSPQGWQKRSNEAVHPNEIKLSVFIEALDGWGLTNDEKSKEILEFQNSGYDLSLYKNRPSSAQLKPPIWEAIDTAPKDGSVILAGHQDFVFTVYWEYGHQNDSRLDGWVDGSSNQYGENTTYHPTHWMPLPEPPK